MYSLKESALINMHAYSGPVSDDTSESMGTCVPLGSRIDLVKIGKSSRFSHAEGTGVRIQAESKQRLTKFVLVAA